MADDGSQVSAPGEMGSPARGMPVEGEIFAGRYHVQRLLGRGGMGMVYLAVQAPLDRPVALKVLRPVDEQHMDQEFRSRFLREAEAAARLQHPHTITTYDFGTTDEGIPYIVMEYLEGRDLRRVLASEWPFPLERTLHIAQDICKSVQDAHEKGMIHRDLKPSNVLLVKRDDDEDFAVVFDFGLVKFSGEDQDLTQAGVFLGSPRFTFPEALDSAVAVDHRADIYSTGILIYSMVAGQPPFNGEPMAVLSAHLNEMPQPMCEVAPRAHSCAALESVVARCLRKDAADRFQSMRELGAALKKIETAVQRDEVSLELDLSHNRAMWANEFSGDDDEDRKPTYRTLRVDTAKPERPRWGPTHMVFLLVVVLFAVVAMVGMFLGGGGRLTQSPSVDSAANEGDQRAPELRDIGVSLLSAEVGLAVSYMGVDGRWNSLGVITTALQESWPSSAQSPWWTAQIEPEQQVLSVLLVSPNRPGRRLELPIEESGVRFDLAAAEWRAPLRGGAEAGSAVSLVPAPTQQGHTAQPRRSEPSEAGDGTTPSQQTNTVDQTADGDRAADGDQAVDGGSDPSRDQKQDSAKQPASGRGISSDYKDNPY